MKLKSMSIDRLTTLREKVDSALRSKITERRRGLEAELSKLSRFRGPVGRGLTLGKRSGSVAPKYRNPENPSETWAGRGLKPRWLVAALKTGHKLEDFLIGGAPKLPATKRPKQRKAAARKSPKPREAAASRKAKATRKASTPRKALAPKTNEQSEASA